MQDDAARLDFGYDIAAEAGRLSPSGYVLDAMRRRPVGRRLLSLLTGVLFLGGMMLFFYPLLTDVYTDSILQNQLENEFQQAFDQITVTTIEEYEQVIAGQSGRPLTRIAMPDIGVETLVVEGTSPAALRAGAGHYPNTPLPGQVGNVAIAGHRTTYGKPFNRIDELTQGSEIWLSTPVGDYLYVVSPPPANFNGNPMVTDPRNWTVIDQTPNAVLTLTTCHPKGSAAQRLIVRAELVQEFPAGHYESSVRDA